MSDSENKTNNALPLRRISREWSLQYLYQRDLSGEDSQSSLEWFWSQHETNNDSDYELGEKEIQKCKRQATSTIEGVLDNLEAIDAKIESYAKNWSLERMAAIDRNILRVATYELLYRDEIPGAVSINEALEIVKVFSSEQKSSAFINGILDKIKKETENAS